VDSSLSRDVQMQFMRPGQLEAALRAFPVVYVPFGLIEWHGRHLPLGNDALKAHAILVKCAEQFGGAVYPPLWLHSGFDQEHLVPVYRQLFERIKATGARVIIGISGHNVKQQIEMIEKALEPVTADGTCVGFAGWEITLSRCEESATDHAAKWETSNMMFFYPDRVDMSTLGDEPITLDMSPPHGGRPGHRPQGAGAACLTAARPARFRPGGHRPRQVVDDLIETAHSSPRRHGGHGDGKDNLTQITADYDRYDRDKAKRRCQQEGS